MGDPVTMAIIGASAGAMLNKKDPLKGALLGAAGGFGGATMLAGAGAAGAAGTAAMPGVAGGAIAPGAFGAPAIAPTVSTIAPSGTGIFSSLGTPALGGITPYTPGPSTGLISSSLAPAPTFMENITGGLKDFQKFTQQNPTLTQMGVQASQNLLSQQEPQLPAPGLMRGSAIQTQPRQYQIGVPQVSLI